MGRWYSDWIWIPLLRQCRVGEDKVEITQPLIFGRSFLFDRARQMVTMKRRLFGVLISTEEIPFSDVNIETRLGSSWLLGASPGDPTTFSVEISIAGRRKIGIYPAGTNERRSMRIRDAIQMKLR